MVKKLSADGTLTDDTPSRIEPAIIAAGESAAITFANTRDPERARYAVEVAKYDIAIGRMRGAVDTFNEARAEIIRRLDRRMITELGRGAELAQAAAVAAASVVSGGAPVYAKLNSDLRAEVGNIADLGAPLLLMQARERFAGGAPERAALFTDEVDTVRNMILAAPANTGRQIAATAARTGDLLTVFAVDGCLSPTIQATLRDRLGLTVDADLGAWRGQCRLAAAREKSSTMIDYIAHLLDALRGNIRTAGAIILSRSDGAGRQAIIDATGPLLADIDTTLAMLASAEPQPMGSVRRMGADGRLS